MVFADITPGERPRAQLRKTFLDGGTPPEWVDQIVDIACQAADQAFAAAMRTLDLLPDQRAQICAIGPAMSFIAADAERTIAGLKEFSTKAGIEARAVSLG